MGILSQHYKNVFKETFWNSTMLAKFKYENFREMAEQFLGNAFVVL